MSVCSGLMSGCLRNCRPDNPVYAYNGLKKYEGYFILPEVEYKADPSWFGFLITVRKDTGFTRDEIVKYLENNKIATRMLFAGNIIRHPSFKGIKYSVCEKLDNTDFIMKNTFWLGVYPGLNSEMMEYIISKIGKFIKKGERI